MYEFTQSKLKSVKSTLDLIPYINALMTFNNLKMQLSMALRQVYVESKQQESDNYHHHTHQSNNRRNKPNLQHTTSQNNVNYNTIQSLFLQIQRFSDVKNDISLNSNNNKKLNNNNHSRYNNNNKTMNKTPSLISRQRSIKPNHTNCNNFNPNYHQNNSNHHLMLNTNNNSSKSFIPNHNPSTFQDIVYNEECDSSQNCLALQRIIKALRYYNNITSNEEDKFDGDDDEKRRNMDKHKNNGLWITYFNDKNYKHLLNDFHHVLSHHLRCKDINKSNQEFEVIYREIMKNGIKPCDVTRCYKFRRNRRIREHENIDILNCNNNDLCNFYTETLDSIHCYFLHSFDIGMRVKLNDIRLTNDDDVNHEPPGNKKQKKVKVDDNAFYTDKQLAKLKKLLNIKLLPLKRQYVIKGGQNKYFSNMNDEPEPTLPRTLAPLCKNVFNDHKQRKFEVFSIHFIFILSSNKHYIQNITNIADNCE